MRAVFYNSVENMCSIHKTGLMCYDILKRSRHFDLEYREDQTVVDGCDFVIFNHHYIRNNWMDEGRVRAFRCLSFCIVSEVGLYSDDPAPLTPKIFDHYLVLDPTMMGTGVFHPLPRPLPFYDGIAAKPGPDGVVIGSFGLATYGKNWRAIFEAVKKDFDKDGCTLRINLAPSKCIPRDVYDRVVCEVWSASFVLDRKSKIRFEFTEHEFSDKGLVEWCAQNSINVFLYDRDHDTGLAAVADIAVAVGRPILVSSHATFRHLHRYIDVFPRIGIKEAMVRNHAGVLQMREDWSPDHFLHRFEKILLQIKKV